jgi:hypothetical protein
MNDQKKRTTQMFGLIVALLALTAWFALPSRNSVVNAATSVDNPLVGMWEMTVQGSATYHYKYAISDGTWVATGDIDGNFYGYRYSPTVGAYAKDAGGSYSYRERGWTYTQGGICNGTFESTGRFELDASGGTFSGPGVFKQFDLKGRTILSEPFTVVATKVGV